MDDEQLKQFSPEEARQQLNDEQLERYNELKEEELQGNIDEDKTEKAGQAAEGLSVMRRQAEGDLTVEVYGIEFVADINPGQAQKLMQLGRYEDEKPEDLDQDEFAKVHDSFLSILSDLSVDFDRSDWNDEFGDAGIKTLATIVGELLAEIDGEIDIKKNR